VQDVKAKGKTVVLITHRPGILAVADRLLLLRDGRIQAEGPRDEVLAGLQAAANQARSGPATTGAPQVAPV